MKKTTQPCFKEFFFFCFLFITGVSVAQVNNPHEVLAVSGSHTINGYIELSWTLGEPIIPTLFRNQFILTQGFHQSEDRFLNIYESPELQTVITPNGDGLNDYFILEDLLVYPDNEITIVNRWGSVVFHAKPYLNDWNGQSDAGKSLAEGTYYFLVRLKPEVTSLLYGSITIKK